MINNSDVVLPSNSKFGFFFTFFFTVAGIIFFYKNLFVFFYLFLFLALFLFLITLINPKLLSPLNRLWMNFGLFLGLIVSPIVLGVIFFLIFTPVSLILKLIGRDELNIKLINKNSYWKKVDDKVLKENSFKQQF